MAFRRFAGDSLIAALDAGEQQREKMSDTGRTLLAEGVPHRSSSQEFERTGGAAEFTDAVRKHREYFRGWLGALESNPFISGNNQA